MFCRIQKCCLCLSLEIGCYVAATFSIILGVICLALQMAELSTHADLKLVASPGQSSSELNRRYGVYDKIVSSVIIVLYSCWVMSAFLLLFGTVKRKKGMLVPWMVLTTTLLILTGFGMLAGIALSHGNLFKDALLASVVVVCVLILLSGIYALLCVASFYNVLKENSRSQTIDVILQCPPHSSLGYAPPPYPGPASCVDLPEYELKPMSQMGKTQTVV